MKKKILIIPSTRLYPMDSGGAHGQLAFLDQQQQQHDITLVLTPENIKEKDLPAFQQLFPALKMVAFGFDKKKKGVFSFLQTERRKLSGKDFFYMFRKQPLVGYFLIDKPHVVEAIADYAKNNRFDLIQVEHTRNLGLVEVLPADVKKIFIHHEIAYTRIRQDMSSLNYPASFIDYVTGMAEGIETSWLKQYDGIITFNEDDTVLLQSKGIDKPYNVASPFALFKDELKNIYHPEEEQVLLFIGGAGHYPNKEGLAWFLDEIYPTITDKKYKVVVSNHWPEDFKKKYEHLPVEFPGFIEDLDTVLKKAIAISPIRIGSGIRVKVFTSMAKGVPVISTTLGASGIPGLQHGENILLADDATSFANGLVQLMEDKALRKKVSEGAYNLSADNFVNRNFVDERNRFYDELLNS